VLFKSNFNQDPLGYGLF